ncbi:helix-turn-helix transcriptional regulator [Actinomyces sp. zg-332]|uniref:helix-turn-helix domain-containing protein n=1 Tax=Actinomyces sp. zg-332 TaxID=2708340 RepID=UPI0014209488|nr:helix-turn-helix transcriptional regulator [Actinomyces sp. zg-332]QPK93613.1 helix-turn-helix transcriptional regulator [Actinomyces sp. zg-332]
MNFASLLRELRNNSGLTQEQFAHKIGVSRAAIAKWESNRGIPDIANLIQISDIFDISLDELVRGDKAVQKKVVADSKTKKWHYLVILYLSAILVYIAYFVVYHRIFMAGFMIATIFMLGIEISIFVKDIRKLTNK